MILFFDLIDAIPRLRLRGFDLEPVLLGRSGKEAADAVGLPIRGFLDLGEAGALGSPNQRQDLRALALGARRAGFLGGRGLRGLFTGLGVLLGRGLALPPLAAFWPLGAPFFWVAPFFERAFSGATGVLCSATVAVCSATAAAFSVVLASAFFMVVNPFLRLVSA